VLSCGFTARAAWELPRSEPTPPTVGLDLAQSQTDLDCADFASQAEAAQALLEFKDDELTDENIGTTWRRLQAVEAAAKKVRAALAGYLEIKESPIALGGGAELKLIEATRESIIPDVAMPILRDTFGDDADEAVSLTKKGIERLAEGHAKQVLATLRDAGATKTTYSKSLREGASANASQGGGGTRR
jgi:hypothetical protein